MQSIEIDGPHKKSMLIWSLLELWIAIYTLSSTQADMKIEGLDAFRRRSRSAKQSKELTGSETEYKQQIK